MANGSRDVELVIKAKDDTTKVVSSIVKALNELTDGLTDTGKAVSKGDSDFSKLGKSLQSLERTMRGMSSADRLNQQLQSATQQTEKLEAAAASTAAELTDLSKRMNEAATTTGAFTAQAKEAAATLDKEKASLAANKAAHKELAQQYRESTQARAQLETQEKNLTATLERQQTSLQKSQERLQKYSVEIANADTPTKRLVNSFNAAQQSVDKNSTAIAQTTERLANTRALLEAAGAAEAQFAQQVTASKSALDAQAATIKTLNTAQAESARQARDAAAAEAAVEKQYRETASALTAQQAGVTRANEALGVLKTNASEAQTAFAQLAQAARGPLLEAYSQQQRTISQINNQYQETRKSLADLSATMGAVGVPTREMAEAYQRLNQTANDTATAYKEQMAVLQQLRAELKEEATDTQALVTKQQLFATALRNGSQTLQQVEAATQKAGAASERVVAAQQQLSRAYQSTSGTAQQASENTNELANATDKASEAYVRAANSSRTALDFTQRLRGEVLSLISTYAGFYGIINILSQTVDAYRTLEAAQSRLNAIHGNDQKAVANDLDFVRRNADRLGIQFGVLAQEYTKFSASTQNTIIQGQKTRDIFLAVAEAGRVNKLSLEDVSGIFTALTQIASKGRFQLEELSGQLGDRLPGALQIMADGLGVSTAELLKMTKAGTLTADHLTDFANELNKRYGGALAASLETTTTAMGKLQNAVFETLAVFGKAGFLQGFTDLVKQLTTTLQSADFQSFAQRVSEAFGVLTRVISLAVSNWKLLTVAASAFIGLKLGTGIVSFVTSLSTMNTTLGAAIRWLGATSAATTALGVASGAAATEVTALGTAIKGTLASTVVGLAFVAIGTAIAAWATSTDKATAAMKAHQTLVDSVKNSYDAAGGSVENWSQKIQATTLLEAKTNLQTLQQQAQAAREAGKVMGAAFNVGGTSGPARAIAEQIKQVQEQFILAGGSVNDFKQRISDLALQTNDQRVKDYANAILEALNKQQEWSDKIKEANLVLVALTGTQEQAKAALDELTGRNQDNAKSVKDVTSATDEWNNALQKIHKTVPSLTEDFKQLQELANLDAAYQSALKFAKSMGEVQRITAEYNQTLKEIGAQGSNKLFSGVTSGREAAARLIRDRESFSPKAFIDNDGRPRVGFSSDTKTDSSGNKSTVTIDSTSTLEEANRDLYRRIDELVTAITNSVGSDRFASFTDAQQAALTSIAYNYGALPDRIMQAVKTGSNQEIADAIQGLAGDNGGINRVRRLQEASFFSSDDNAVERQSRLYDKQLETDQKHEAATQKSLTAMETELQKQLLINDGKGREAAIETAIAKLKAENPKLTDAEIQKATELAGRLYDAQQIRKEAKQDQKDATLEEQKVNALLQQRNALITTYQNQLKNGDTAGAEATRSKIEDLNKQITDAIDNAEKMWRAIGGPAADVAIAKLEAARAKAVNIKDEAQKSFINWTKVGELFANDLTDAFGNFAQAVANGTSIGEAARDAFLKFASDFLIQIGKMILQQAIFNLLRSLGGPFAAVGGVSFPAAHTGGVVGSAAVGSGNMRRSVSPAVFMNAPKFHDGGLPGLRPGEIPTILKEGEEVLSENSPRNILNGGAAANQQGGNGNPVAVRIFNTFDSADVVRQGLATTPGEQGIINAIKSNRSTIRSILQNG